MAPGPRPAHSGGPRGRTLEDGNEPMRREEEVEETNKEDESGDECRI